MIYYSHSRHIYDTFREYSELKWLIKEFDCVICPNYDLGYFDNTDSHLNIIGNCDTLVLSEYEGHVGRGVFGQVMIALSLEKKVYVLRNNKLFEVENVKVVDTNDWSVRYGKVKIRESEVT